MSKFKENDEVWIENDLGLDQGIVKGVGSISGVGPVYSIETCDGDELLVRESALDYQDLMNAPIEEYEESSFSVDDYLTEMATIAFTNKLNVAVNPERYTLNIPYFKVYDNGKIDASKRVARLHFKDSGIEIHNHDRLGKKPWLPSNDVVKDIRNILGQLDPTRDNLYTVWQVLCYEWNRINDLIPVNTTVKEYVSGKYDNQHFNDTRLEKAYVPSTQKIPDTWIYDPSKGKK